MVTAEAQRTQRAEKGFNTEAQRNTEMIFTAEGQRKQRCRGREAI